MPPIARAFDQLIRTHKDKDVKNVSVEDVAVAINSKGFSATYLYALRAGAKRNPTVSTPQILADFFGVDHSMIQTATSDTEHPADISSTDDSDGQSAS